ncbi:hypothetical protein G9A89_016927 [Geosiphon pyriformis]|nr:hypothetical protein G9A89_016927 [Geosiphon pyriformis]
MSYRLPFYTALAVTTRINIGGYESAKYWCSSKLDTLSQYIICFCFTGFPIMITLFCFIKIRGKLAANKSQIVRMNPMLIITAEDIVTRKVASYVLVFLLQWIPLIIYVFCAMLNKIATWNLVLTTIGVNSGGIGNAANYIFNEFRGKRETNLLNSSTKEDKNKLDRGSVAVPSSSPEILKFPKLIISVVSILVNTHPVEQIGKRQYGNNNGNNNVGSGWGNGYGNFNTAVPNPVEISPTTPTVVAKVATPLPNANANNNGNGNIGNAPTATDIPAATTQPNAPTTSGNGNWNSVPNYRFYIPAAWPFVIPQFSQDGNNANNNGNNNIGNNPRVGPYFAPSFNWPDNWPFRVSEAKQKEDLERQKELPTYELSDIGSGISFKRSGLQTYWNE